VPENVSLKTSNERVNSAPRASTAPTDGQSPAAFDERLASQYSTSTTATGLKARCTLVIIGFEKGSGKLSAPNSGLPLSTSFGRSVWRKPALKPCSSVTLVVETPGTKPTHAESNV
jgi:hypothetical protein